ncbi:unnamed protein product [Linum trigynum]|uniref:non-specific serine/threonine protein kinase n=1 Tax=Linum trigynum TaxID=586398 RepID=A0AAV2GF58_9ROSI
MDAAAPTTTSYDSNPNHHHQHYHTTTAFATKSSDANKSNPRTNNNNNVIMHNNQRLLPSTSATRPPTTTTSSSTSSGTSASTSNSRNDNIDSSSSMTSSVTNNASLKPHTGGDSRWDSINTVVSCRGAMGLSNFRLLKRLGYGDIGSVYLVELRGTTSHFAMKVMDKASLASRNKLLRAQTEREILGLLDHPFLPTLYSYFETDKFYCLVMEFCSGGNLHSLRQKQPTKYFSEDAARFYASEVLLALEYLHMLGIVYRDLKPENVLVRDEGHIMLSDFDLSLRCSVNPTLVKSSSVSGGGGGSSSSGTSAAASGGPAVLAGSVGSSTNAFGSGGGAILDEEFAVHGCIQPSTFFPRSILPSKKNRKSKSDFGLFVGGSLPELMAEPTNVRSMSFVGTHEYLAPEIIRGEGHGSAVDWWTFGIFLYELLHGTTPFKGSGNRATLYNVVGQPLRFPDSPQVSYPARDLIRGLLVKEPHKRIAYKRGATEIKQHPFFEGLNWALVRSLAPPHVPEPVDFSHYASKEPPPPQPSSSATPHPTTSAASPSVFASMAVENKTATPAHSEGHHKHNGHVSPTDDDSSYIDFEYF